MAKRRRFKPATKQMRRDYAGRDQGARPSAVRRRPKLRFFVILVLFLAVVAVALVFLLRGQETAAVEMAKVEFSAEYNVLIVRDEVVYEAKNYGKTQFVAVQGQHVQPGDSVVEVYEWGYNDETFSELLDVQKEILTHEAEVIKADIIDEELIDINKRIEGKAAEIQGAVAAQQPERMLGLEREMQALLDERSAHLRDVMPDEVLRELLEEERVLLETIAGWRSVIVAEQAGAVSFYFDGTESLMTKENIGSYTAKSLVEVMEGKTVEMADHDQAMRPLYRVVDPNEWYVLILSAEEIPEMYVGNGYSLILDDYLATQFTGVVMDATELENNDGFVYTILIQDDIGPLLDKRRVSARVFSEIEGLRIPRSCVKETDQVQYVETEGGELIPVYIIANDGENVFVQTYDGEKTLEIGQILKK